MKTRKHKLASLALALVLVLGVLTPGAAAAETGKLIVNGKTYSGSNPIDILSFDDAELGKEVDTLQIVSGSYSKTYGAEDCAKGATEKLPNGTTYQVYSQESSGYRSIKFKINNTLADQITVTYSLKAKDYAIFAGSGFYGKNNNRGGADTCAPAAGSTVKKGGEKYEVTFTPVSGQDLTYLNVQLDTADAPNNVFSVSGTTTKTVGKTTFTIQQLADGKVKVSFPVNRNVYLTALTQDETAKYSLNVTAKTHVKSDITTVTVPSGTAKTVKLTADTGYNVDTVKITSGGASGTITAGKSSVSIGGKTYTLTRALDGSATLSIPTMTANVEVEASAVAYDHYVSVTTGSHVDADHEGVTYVKNGDAFDVTFEPASSSYRIVLKAKTEHGTYTLKDTGTYYYGGNFYYNGAYDPYYGWYTQYSDSFDGIRYWFSTDTDGSIHLHMDSVEKNIQLTATATSSASTGDDYDVTISTGSGIYCDSDDFMVDRGEDASVRFYTKSSSYEIYRIRITYNGDTYYAYPEDDYVLVDGNRWAISGDEDEMTLKMKDIRSDVTLHAYNTNSSSGSYRITKTEDTHSTISYTGGTWFDYKDASTITVSADGSYILDEVKFTMKGKTVTVEPFDTTMTLAGTTYALDWISNQKLQVKVTMYDNLTVKAISRKGDVVYPQGGNNIVITVPGGAMYDPLTGAIIGMPDSITTNPGTGVKPGSTTSTYHAAYMSGYGNGTFGPNNSLTRAQAIAILVRIYGNLSQTQLNTLAAQTTYKDTPAYQWYSPYVAYAMNLEYTSVLTGGGQYLYPNRNISRAEFVALLCKFNKANLTATGSQTKYSDVASTYWAAKYINYATKMGWINGLSDQTFGPNYAITRAQTCAIMNRMLGRTDYAPAYTNVTFTDVPTTYWAYADICEAAISHSAVK